jgi:hypothetical protein
VFVYERLIDAANRLEADLPPADAVLENCRKVAEHGLDAATQIRLQAVLIEREDKRAEQVALGLETALPRGLLGTQFEAMHWINRSRMPEGEPRGREELRPNAATILRSWVATRGPPPVGSVERPISRTRKRMAAWWSR